MLKIPSSVIKRRQKEYYKALETSDKAGSSNAFIEFSLKAMIEAITWKPELKRDF